MRTILFIGLLLSFYFALSIAQQCNDDNPKQSCKAGATCTCKNGGTCVAPDYNSCDCRTAKPTGKWTGYYCQTPLCTGLGQLQCQNGGKCVGPDTCDCTGTGFNGPACTNPVCEKPCRNGGKCVGPNTCECAGTGYTNGPLNVCEVPVCNAPLGCGNGQCVAPNKCQCFDGWTGTVDCNTPVCTEPCNHGYCAGPNSCDCRGTNFTGPHCETPICNPPCANGGNCTEPGVCDCSTAPKGWVGDLCDIPVCDQPCRNGGRCAGPNECDCENTGYVGKWCTEDENECLRAQKPCHALTTCTNKIGTYECSECPTGWEGSGKISEGGCKAVCTEPCQNGGDCFLPNTCNCTGTGYEGATCSVDVDECAIAGCDPLTNCTNFVGGFNCTACPAGYLGTGKTGCRKPGSPTEDALQTHEDIAASDSSKLFYFFQRSSFGVLVILYLVFSVINIIL